MCTYTTVRESVVGSAKGPNGSWSRVSDATVYFDHPVHATAEHTLNIDLSDADGGASRRVALELTAPSARRLIAAIEAALAAVPEELASGDGR
jgi:hypothetical protein